MCLRVAIKQHLSNGLHIIKRYTHIFLNVYYTDSNAVIEETSASYIVIKNLFEVNKILCSVFVSKRLDNIDLNPCLSYYLYSLSNSLSLFLYHSLYTSCHCSY